MHPDMTGDLSAACPLRVYVRKGRGNQEVVDSPGDVAWPKVDLNGSYDQLREGSIANRTPSVDLTSGSGLFSRR